MCEGEKDNFTDLIRTFAPLAAVVRLLAINNGDLQEPWHSYVTVWINMISYAIDGNN